MPNRRHELQRPNYSRMDGLCPGGASNTKATPRKTRVTGNEQIDAPILIPESPLINFLSKLTRTQRLGIHNIRLTEQLGYGCDKTFPNGDSLYQWLTPGDRIITNRAWPAETFRKKWFRLQLSADYVFQFAERVEHREGMSRIFGYPQF
ncbi:MULTISPECIES: hypothetical protein [Marinobacter]|nr:MULTISPECIES: hypothetical protein [Marinobacter]